MFNILPLKFYPWEKRRWRFCFFRPILKQDGLAIEIENRDELFMLFFPSVGIVSICHLIMFYDTMENVMNIEPAVKCIFLILAYENWITAHTTVRKNLSFSTSGQCCILDASYRHHRKLRNLVFLKIVVWRLEID